MDRNRIAKVKVEKLPEKEDRSMKRSLLTVALVVLYGCGGAPHAADEKYFLIASNIKVPYWQEAGAGLRKAAQQLQVSAEMIGPDTYDPQATAGRIPEVVKLKPSGIMVSPSDPKLMKDDIDAAVVQRDSGDHDGLGRAGKQTSPVHRHQ